YLADAEEKRSKQERNNQRQGADAIAGLGVAFGGRREDGVTMGHGGGAGEPNTGLGGTGDHGPLQTGSSSGSFGPDGKPVKSNQNTENGNGSLKPVKSYENTGFFEGIGQRFSNLVSGNGFNTNAGLIHNAEAYGGKLAGLLKASELGYASSAKDVAEVVDYYQKNNRDNNLQAQTEAGKNIVSQAERLMKLNQISPFTYKLGNTGTGGLMDCTGFVYRSNKNAGFDHIPYIGGSSIEVSDHYKALNPSERQAGDIKIITIRDSNGKVVDGHGMIYNGGKTGKEFYEMSSKGMKTNGDYLEKHYTGIYGKKMEKEGYTMEGGYYRPLEKQ
ncbi:peptidase M23, partial [Leptospira stimsonii]